MRTLIIATASIVALLTLTGQAQAQLNRTFVSGHGSDSNPCTLADPCRTFAQALSQTNAGGEIAVLDTAGYGAVNITKSVTITNPGGVEAGVTAASGQDAIQIDGGASSIKVTLRGLTLQGASGSANGINWASGGGTLNIVDCVTKDFGATGILISPASGSPSLKVTISKTTVLNNLMHGIAIATTSGGGQVSYSISQTITNENALDGILINTNSGVTAVGEISSVHSELNNAGLEFTGNGSNMVLFITQSFFKLNDSIDIDNNSSGNGDNVFLYNANIIGGYTLGSLSATVTDGTNDFLFMNMNGGALTKHAPQ